jgi:uncharacterized membrane protein YkvA (DUF1232 family)
MAIMTNRKITYRNFSETAFWSKLRHYAWAAGRQVIEYALQLYYALMDTDTPRWAKAVIGGALVYFVVPVDLIPDFIPGGYVDDFGALASAMAAVFKSIKPEHAAKARAKVCELFKGEEPKNDPSRYRH